MRLLIIFLISAQAFGNPFSCETNRLNLLSMMANNDNYYKYLYALSMARVGVDGELIRRSVDVNEKELLDPGSPELKKMFEQKLNMIESILINSGCEKKEAIKYKYEILKDFKFMLSNQKKNIKRKTRRTKK